MDELFPHGCAVFDGPPGFSDEIPLGPRGRYKERTPSVTHSPEVMDPSELEPFAKPEAALTEALALLADDDWYVQTSYLQPSALWKAL